MKKVFSVLLVLAMLFALCACGGNADKPEDKPENKTEEKLPEKKVSRGTVTEGVYQNEYFGLTADFGEDWTFLSDEDIAQISGLAAEMTDNENLTESLDSGKVVFDFYATRNDLLVSCNLVIEKVGILAGAVLDEKQYIDGQIEQLTEALEAQGLTDVVAEHKTTSLAGKERECISVTAVSAGVPVYEEIIVIKQGGYFSNITVFSSDAAAMQQTKDAFSALS